jgi:inosine-uridine nucleoside N-ribohydrolase
MEEMGWDQDGCALHDALAAAYLVDDSIFQTEETNVAVELADPKLRGITCFSSVTQGKPMMRVVTGVDTQKCRDLIWSHVFEQ